MQSVLPKFHLILADITDSCQFCALLSVDEAGRGPVLGPMVYACAIAPIANKEMLKNMEFDDSKQLTSERRLEMYQDIQTSEKILSFVNAVSAAEISAKMLARQRTSLNEIAEKCTIDLIRWAISQGANIQEVYVDTVGDSKSYQARLSALFDEISFVVCPKADSIYPIVSAASIVAKVSLLYSYFPVDTQHLCLFHPAFSPSFLYDQFNF